eukprot:TRINITY_DN45838_c0_g1_i1.p3 TRINITY_DN45838_c0_g1~~TRINITY_DN45838_c0_g1_i1.p3  ORF type:complete len:155 (-),score=37.26 TRINITY_DN45838_c0_g1_i1:29-469(-)
MCIRDRLEENQKQLLIKQKQLQIQKFNELTTQRQLEILQKEKQEQQLLLQLHKSQIIQKKAIKKLETALIMPINEIPEKFPTQNNKFFLPCVKSRKIDLKKIKKNFTKKNAPVEGQLHFNDFSKEIQFNFWEKFVLPDVFLSLIHI